MSDAQQFDVFNVAITRARKKLIVVSSVTPEDLPNGILREFLMHAANPASDSIPRSAFDSKFEEQVARALERAGMKIFPQFHAAGFYIDLAVGDGKHWIAVECDGPRHFEMNDGTNFRDVLRQAILERAGWKFVRVSHREWERNSDLAIEKICKYFSSFTVQKKS